ncbi:putative sulfate/molybdate transporter [Syntrophomonas erecta]
MDKHSRLGLLNELSGSLGDLGTFLPHVLAAITVAGLDATSIFTGFGIFYIFSGWFYGIPMAVQPMKAASAAILVEKVPPEGVAAAGILMGAILLFLGITGLIERLARITPRGVTAGIQLGLGLSLAILGMHMALTDLWLGTIMLVLMLVLLYFKKLPTALIILVVGTIVGLWLHPPQSWPEFIPALHIPEFIWPQARDFGQAFVLITLPQLPLTLTNAVLVTTVISQELYGAKAERVTEKNLSLTMGAANLLAAPWGGYMMCHGSGGVAAHYRYGGRTRLTPFIMGLLLVLAGVLLGKDAVSWLLLVPEAVLGALLFFSGLDLARAARVDDDQGEWFLALLVAALTLAVNPAIAFLSGILIHKGTR